jgi:hypothetical protein
MPRPGRSPSAPALRIALAGFGLGGRFGSCLDYGDHRAVVMMLMAMVVIMIVTVVVVMVMGMLMIVPMINPVDVGVTLAAAIAHGKPPNS